MTSSTTTPVRSNALPMLGLIALSVSVFLSITSEMMPTGLLPEMSADLGVTESQVGLLVTIFAFTVVLTSTTMIRVTRRLPRHTLMVAILLTLALCNVLTAVLPSYPAIVFARILGGVAHGMFWSLTPAYASRLVAPHLIGRAITIALTGGTLAMILGVPLGTALGHAVGWRVAFGAVAVALALGALAVFFFLPKVAQDPVTPKAAKTDAAGNKVPGSVLPVALICIMVALTMTGYYAFFTYITPFFIGFIGIPAELVSVALLGFGAFGAISLFFTGGIFSRLPLRGLAIGLVGCVVAVSVIAMTAQSPIIAAIAMAIWGFCFGLIPPLAQTLMLRAAAPENRDNAGAFYTTAFNLGIGGGALFGGILLSAYGLGALPILSAALTAAGLVLFLIARGRVKAAVERHSPTPELAEVSA
ncbi:putative MFS family arabinose efflux permease [Mycetocola sp. BIGb0189]|uniref:MFS transporter n=1 Tax=Mycetocola sp. BIGb0189 TaxID=2940604 RepID=UPI002169632B|nr:MFS transporter [Mycetocola sp. BIGb0189]MCS4277808.1 putative MFS family arabinose efflux permease [Mycetocola sp. BIGb0189]